MSTLRIAVHVRDLRRPDLPDCAWSGGPGHTESISAALDRAEQGTVEYLAVCPPSDVPVAIGGIDYEPRPGAGTLWQLVVLPALRSCGLGTVLVDAAEERIRGRGLSRAELAVEEDNPRAHALYRRLGYVAHAREPGEWNEVAADGTVTPRRADRVLFRKHLG